MLLRRPAMIGATLAGLATLVALPTVMRGGPLRINGWPTLMPGIMGALLPIAVWGRDDRFGPGFLWTLPVDRGRHALTKVAAGWIWLMASVLLFLFWLFVLTSITGEPVLPETLHLAASEALAAQPVDPGTLRTVRWSPGRLMWLVPFAGATATYLLASALVLGTRHPLRWVIGVGVFYAITSLVSGPINALLGMSWVNDAPGRLLNLLVGGRYGLDALLTARSLSLSASATLTTGKSLRVWWGVPSLADWGMATLIWTAVGLAALWGAVSRHGERRRG
jgi:hypothetical protein